MKITEHINMLYPSEEKKRQALQKRCDRKEYPSDFASDLEVGRLALMLSPQNTDRAVLLMTELNDDVETLNYRLDCLDDFIAQPKLSDNFRKIIRTVSDNNAELDMSRGPVNSFMEVRLRMNGLRVFADSVEEIKRLYEKIRNTVSSEAVRGVFGFFVELSEDPKFTEMLDNLEQLEKVFSSTIRSVKIGINFTHDMIPDSVGILEVSKDKIYPKGNVLDRLIFKTFEKSERFSGCEHINSATRNQAADMDTALFKELDRYTKEYSRRIAFALKAYREVFISDIAELEHQLDFYDGAVCLINYVRSRGLKMCRPVILPKEERKMKLKNAFDLCFFRQAAAKDYGKCGEQLVVCNDISMDEEHRFYMVTGANNGGKTTFARAVGICQLMAQTGLYVPCEYAEISPCDHIFTHFPKEEEVGIDSSRFTTEIKQLRDIFSLITPESMLIMNESIQSTTPEECLEIAGEHMKIAAFAGVRGMYVTHLTGLYATVCELNKVWENRSKMGSLVMQADKKSGRRLYKIKLSPPEKESLANAIYKQFGISFPDVKKRIEKL